MMNALCIRQATEADIPLILRFIRELALYEHMEDQVVATEEVLHEWMFVRGCAQALIAFAGDEAVGFALYFYNFSTFLGRAGIYLEDLYIRPEYRGKGYGKALMQAIAKICVLRGHPRFEWACLDWNKSSIAFYERLGARAMDDWTVYRLCGDALKALASDE